jgi:hypothetical protein
MSETITSKPEVKSAQEATPSDWRIQRGPIFTWIGIVGGALSIVNFWSNFITLADWMHWLVDHFGQITHRFWSFMGALAGIKISLSLARFLTLTSSYVSIVIGSNVDSGRQSVDNVHKAIFLRFINPLFFGVRLPRCKIIISGPRNCVLDPDNRNECFKTGDII